MSNILPLEMEMRVEEEDEDDPDAVDSLSETADELQEEELPPPAAVTVVPFGQRILVKQEVDENEDVDVEDTDADAHADACVDTVLEPPASVNVTPFHEEVEIKEEEQVQVEEEMILPTRSENVTCLGTRKDSWFKDKDASFTKRTVAVENDNSEEEEILPQAAMVVVPGCADDYPEDFVEENIAVRPTMKSTKRQKSAAKRVDTVYRCPNCSLCYTSPEYLAGHVRRGCRYRPSPIQNAYRCITCGEGFSNYGDLYQHKRQKHDQDKKGGSEVKSKDAAAEKKTSGSRGLPCPNCPRFFSTPGYLVQHMRAHVRSRTDRTCDVCGEKVPEPLTQGQGKGPMEEHFAKKHPDMHLHRCGECGKAYGRRHNLVTHLLSHQGTEEFKCYVCNKEFANRALLSAHLRTHPSTRPFECSECGKTYLQQGRFYEHRRREHGIVEKPVASPLVMWPKKDGTPEDIDAEDVEVIVPDRTPKEVMIMNEVTKKENTSDSEEIVIC